MTSPIDANERPDMYVYEIPASILMKSPLIYSHDTMSRKRGGRRNNTTTTTTTT